MIIIVPRSRTPIPATLVQIHSLLRCPVCSQISQQYTIICIDWYYKFCSSYGIWLFMQSGRRLRDSRVIKTVSWTLCKGQPGVINMKITVTAVIRCWCWQKKILVAELHPYELKLRADWWFNIKALACFDCWPWDSWGNKKTVSRFLASCGFDDHDQRRSMLLAITESQPVITCSTAGNTCRLLCILTCVSLLVLSKDKFYDGLSINTLFSLNQNSKLEGIRLKTKTWKPWTNNYSAWSRVYFTSVQILVRSFSEI